MAHLSIYVYLKPSEIGVMFTKLANCGAPCTNGHTPMAYHWDIFGGYLSLDTLRCPQVNGGFVRWENHRTQWVEFPAHHVSLPTNNL